MRVLSHIFIMCLPLFLINCSIGPEQENIAQTVGLDNQKQQDFAIFQEVLDCLKKQPSFAGLLYDKPELGLKTAYIKQDAKITLQHCTSDRTYNAITVPYSNQELENLSSKLNISLENEGFPYEIAIVPFGKAEHYPEASNKVYAVEGGYIMVRTDPGYGDELASRLSEFREERFDVIERVPVSSYEVIP